MFGHLSAEDFTNLLEGTALPDRRQVHLRSCPRCLKKFESVQEVRNQISEMRMDAGEFVPEPDWSQFRSDVRDALLSRSVKRENANRNRWNALAFRPALALGLSLLLVIGLTITTSVLWNRQTNEAVQNLVTVVEEPLTEEESISSIAGMSQTDIFDDLLHLNADEAASFQMILEDLNQKGVSQQ